MLRQPSGQRRFLFMTSVTQWMAMSEKPGLTMCFPQGNYLAHKLWLRARNASVRLTYTCRLPRTFQWNITVNLPAGYEAAAEGVEKLNVKVENECGAFIAKSRCSERKTYTGHHQTLQPQDRTSYQLGQTT